MNVAAMVVVPVTCPECFRSVHVRAPYVATVEGGVEVAREPVALALRLHVTRGCEQA